MFMDIGQNDPLRLTLPGDAQRALGQWLRLNRQRQILTLSMLASKSGVPVMTLSRLEREGKGSVDALMRTLMARGELDRFNACIQEQLRQEALPRDLSELETQPRRRQRVWIRKSGLQSGKHQTLQIEN